MTCGIYCLYYETDDFQYYIGKSLNIEDRYKRHCRDLKSGLHSNLPLLKGYNLADLPSISIIEEVDPSELSDKEIWWIKEFNSFKDGMNGTTGGEGASFGEDNICALYDKETYIKIFKCLALTDSTPFKISKELNVAHSVVKSISGGTKHSYLEKEYPIEYNLMLQKIGSRKHGTLDYNIEVYKRILQLLVYSDKTCEAISKELDVTTSIVKDISRGASHNYLKDIMPEEYSILESKRLSRKISIHTRPLLISPEGKVYDVQVGSISSFARANGLNPSHLCLVLNGKRSQHKGWKVYNEQQ